MCTKTTGTVSSTEVIYSRDVSFVIVKIHLLPFLIPLRTDDWILDHYMIRNALIGVT